MQVAAQDGLVMLRDSKNPAGGIQRYSMDEIRAFAQGVLAGEFDNLLGS